MARESMGIVRGSGNVFRDLGLANPELEHLRAVLAAATIRTLDEGRLSVRAAEARTGVAAADFSRIRQAKLGRFTVDRLMTILHRLGQCVRVAVTVTERRAASFQGATQRS